ncbi:hypothetical protein HYPBUDRAFT_202177 [Hyphopichia burtonii NRRL Y-1933]|uniref:Uncharacterized protein n=1 Tax=Hyphopichia burtonii NRRL Y-1933 TaxID=984485 RepID=A0A1E4RLD9_9ASCO|nr:hypothetical protein HYPBUDRAFT_202177 [Hyphopichia burtonii NRRL Y-1933]ODV68082.1 hypothetical protein HYPBUDRAFT_202177 [Hyphopichia burtonii NRRL Y-1933]
MFLKKRTMNIVRKPQKLPKTDERKQQQGSTLMWPTWLKRTHPIWTPKQHGSTQVCLSSRQLSQYWSNAWIVAKRSSDEKSSLPTLRLRFHHSIYSNTIIYNQQVYKYTIIYKYTSIQVYNQQSISTQEYNIQSFFN